MDTASLYSVNTFVHYVAHERYVTLRLRKRLLLIRGLVILVILTLNPRTWSILYPCQHSYRL